MDVYNRTSHIAHRTSPYSLSSSGRILEVDALRGFAIFLVVLGHAIILFPVNIHEDFFYGTLNKIIYSFHMPLMFVISGFCWSFSDYRTSLQKKFLRLVIPYTAFNLIDMLPRQILASLVRRPKPFIESLKTMLLYGGEFWFLYVLFIIFMLYPLIYRLAGSGRLRMITAAVILFCVSYHGVSISVFQTGKVIYYLFFFHAGVMMRHFCLSEGKFRKINIPAFIIPLSWTLWFILIFYAGQPRILTALAGITASCLTAKYELFNKAFSCFGKYSLQIYLLNGITLGISRALICNVFHIYNPTIIVAFNVFIDFFVSYAFIKYVCERSRIIRFIMGM